MVKTKTGMGPLRAEIPLLGPRFLPPSYLHRNRRKAMADVTPEIAYMKPFTAIHPLYFDIAKCPRCDATGDDVTWNGWTTTGHCEVHGLEREETTLGYQLRCKRCAMVSDDQKKPSKNGEGTHCWATTNYMFWERREHWEIPGKYGV